MARGAIWLSFPRRARARIAHAAADWSLIRPRPRCTPPKLSILNPSRRSHDDGAGGEVARTGRLDKSAPARGAAW